LAEWAKLLSAKHRHGETRRVEFTDGDAEGALKKTATGSARINVDPETCAYRAVFSGSSTQPRLQPSLNSSCEISLSLFVSTILKLEMKNPAV
jgi:hypothetical protein